MSFDPRALKPFTDGSCKRNPGGESGYAIVAEYPVDWNRPDEAVLQVGYESSTNNRMELLAVVRAVEYPTDESRIKQKRAELRPSLCVEGARRYWRDST